MASKQLTATVRLNTTQAERKLKNIARAIDAINNAVGKEAKAYVAVVSALGRTTTETDRARRATERLASATDKNKKSLSETENIAGSLGRKLGALAATYVSLQGAELLTENADTVTKAQNKLNALEGGSPELTQEAMDKMYAASMRSRSLYSDMLDNVSKTMALAGSSFDNNIDNAIHFQEIMAKAYTLGGASEHEKSTSMYQLVQALGSGILQGDELRSVREGAPIAYKKIEEFAQGVLKTEESLKDLASQGVITSDIIVAAIMDAEKEINAAFKDTKVTFEDTLNKIKSQTLKALEPTLEKLTNILNSERGQKAINGITQAIVILAEVLGWVIIGFGLFFNWCVDNWEWLKYVVLGVTIVLIGAFIAMKWAAITAALAAIVNFITMYKWLIVIVAVVMFLLYVFELWRQGAISTTELIIYCLAAIAVMLVGVAFMTQAWWLLWIVLALAVLAVVMMFFSEVCGAVTWFGILFKNIGLAVANFGIAIAKWVATAFMNAIEWVVVAFKNSVAWIVNVACGLGNSILAITQNIGIAFSNAWNWAKNSFWNFIADCIEGLDWLAKPMEKIAELFGKDFSYEGLVSNVRDKANDKIQDFISVGDAWNTGYHTKEYTSGEYGSLSDAWKEGINTFDVFQEGWGKDAYNIGYEWGQGVEDKINKWGSKWQNQDGSYNGLFTEIGDWLGLNGSKLPDPNASKLGEYNPEIALDDIQKGLDKLNGTTSDISNGMDLVDDDLEFLRKIADMEWRNEFTTAEIKVDMTNYNNVEGERDLDGIVEYLAETIRSEMTSVAYGVHID